MNLPKFTIIIPTRERCDTLVAALRTCVTQDYDNLEIIVSDNFSQDNTSAIVHSYQDKRIRYINTGQRVGMSTNWEFALSHVTEGYVTFIGDDDGFLPGAVLKIAETISGSGMPPAFAWGRAVYHWPNYPLPDRQNTLFFHTDHRLLKLEATEWLRQLTLYKCPWASLPSVYNSFINLPIINEIKQRGNGRFFNSAIPDIYSAIAIASHIDTYYFSMRPYAIAGLSRHSTGNSFSNLQVDARPAQRFLTENEIAIHPQLVMSSLSTICATECLLQARDVGLLPPNLSIDLKRLIEAALLEASEEPIAEYPVILEGLRQIGVKNGLESYVEKAIAGAMHSPAIQGKPLSARDLRRHGLVLNCNEFSIKDVYEATLLCEQALTSTNSLKYLFPLGTLRLTARSYLPFLQKRMRKLLRKLGAPQPAKS